MELNPTPFILNLLIFWVLGESAEGFFKEEIERSKIFLIKILFVIYAVDMLMLAVLNYFFSWSDSYTLFLKEQSFFFLILSSAVFVSIFIRSSIKKFS